MRFSDALTMAIGLLVREKQLSYRFLKREFELDAAALEDLRFELIVVHRLAVDRNDELLLWAGAAPAADAGTTLATLAPSDRAAVQPEPARPAARSPEPIHSSAEPYVSDAERRPLTVMFCDLADSTALSAELDPEDLQDVIRAYQERCTVRSGLAIIEAMALLNAGLGRAKGIEIAVRIGIATGIVMVGEVVGEGLAQERTVIGEAPNMAARLQGLAGRNGIVVGALTKEVAGDAFVYQELGAHELKGISGRVKVWGVAGLTAELAEEAETDSGATPPALIGRDEETGLLRRAWQSTKDEGRGQVVLISGEAGIGKSVLVDGLRAEVRAEGLPRIAFRCSPYHTNSALTR